MDASLYIYIYISSRARCGLSYWRRYGLKEVQAATQVGPQSAAPMQPAWGCTARGSGARRCHIGAGLYYPAPSVFQGWARPLPHVCTACACCFCFLIQVVVETASKILTLVDLAGHAKYLKTTVRLGVRISARAGVFERVRVCICMYVHVCV
jgi:hypothetical protein